MKREKKKKRTFQSDASLGSMGDLFNAVGFHSGDARDDVEKDAAEEICDEGQVSRAYRLRKERKGRAGRTVIIVSGLSSDQDVLKRLSRRMKKDLGCGATIEGDEIVLQGDIEARVRGWLDSDK